MKHLAHQFRSPWWLIVTMSASSMLAWFVNAHAPDSWQRITIFFTFVTIISFSILHFLLSNVRHVLLITGGVIIVLTLRLLGLREIIYHLLLTATLLSLELMLRKR